MLERDKFPWLGPRSDRAILSRAFQRQLQRANDEAARVRERERMRAEAKQRKEDAKRAAKEERARARAEEKQERAALQRQQDAHASAAPRRRRGRPKKKQQQSIRIDKSTTTVMTKDKSEPDNARMQRRHAPQESVQVLGHAHGTAVDNANT